MPIEAEAEEEDVNETVEYHFVETGNMFYNSCGRASDLLMDPFLRIMDFADEAERCLGACRIGLPRIARLLSKSGS